MEVIAVLGVVIGLFNTGWQVYVFYSSQTIPARLEIHEIEDLELGVHPEISDISLASTAKFLVTLDVITNHEYRLSIIDGRFEWYDVTEWLGASYISSDQGVYLTARRDGRPQELVRLQSGPIDLWISISFRFKVNQTAIRRFNLIPLGKFYFTLEYLDLKTNYKLHQTNMTRVYWAVRRN
jgi:hypothetical protein